MNTLSLYMTFPLEGNHDQKLSQMSHNLFKTNLFSRRDVWLGAETHLGTRLDLCLFNVYFIYVCLTFPRKSESSERFAREVGKGIYWAGAAGTLVYRQHIY